ncbi:MAG: hypothetical protein Barrevirus27_2 [Barrevirus sp.]|uniref:Uncharacterized protein n=1 Tax=Barrevirus sp. TaxID=2487763 RepID=A0A3G4ZQX3_9VIRU|nr:MAG: hypothetical protein Barrevirus27_2 [Barrevirus sp.]
MSQMIDSDNIRKIKPKCNPLDQQGPVILPFYPSINDKPCTLCHGLKRLFGGAPCPKCTDNSKERRPTDIIPVIPL